jgi:FkbM family methyltransferase
MYVALGWHAGENPRNTPEWQRVSGWRPECLRKPGLDPRTVIDVGAATGTPALYRAFPGAYRVLIDPLEEHMPKEPLDDGEFILTALGSESGTAWIELGVHTLEHSTIAGWRGVRGEGREVPVTTLDALFAERHWRPPFGVKVDAEGYEDRVIRGAEEVLAEAQFVIAEIQVADRFRDGCSVVDILALLESNGFVLHDILDAHKGQEDAGMHYMDGLFVRKPEPR